VPHNPEICTKYSSFIAALYIHVSCESICFSCECCDKVPDLSRKFIQNFVVFPRRKGLYVVDLWLWIKVTLVFMLWHRAVGRNSNASSCVQEAHSFQFLLGHHHDLGFLQFSPVLPFKWCSNASNRPFLRSSNFFPVYHSQFVQM